MDEKDMNNIIAAALAFGFKDLGEDTLSCTKEQLCNYAALIACSAIEQIAEENT